MPTVTFRNCLMPVLAAGVLAACTSSPDNVGAAGAESTTARETDADLAQAQHCWDAVAGGRQDKPPIVRLRVSVAQDGTITEIKDIVCEEAE